LTTEFALEISKFNKSEYEVHQTNSNDEGDTVIQNFWFPATEALRKSTFTEVSSSKTETNRTETSGFRTETLGFSNQNYGFSH
jgi:hypothetical protein